MKRKVLGIALTGLFIIGIIATVNTNQTTQEKNIEILKALAISPPGDMKPGDEWECLARTNTYCEYSDHSSSTGPGVVSHYSNQN